MSKYQLTVISFPSRQLDEAGDIVAGEYVNLIEREADLVSEVNRLKADDSVIGYQVLIDEGEAWALYDAYVRQGLVWRVQWRFVARGNVWQAGRLAWSEAEARALVMRLNVKPSTLFVKLDEMNIDRMTVTPMLACERVWQALECT